MEQLDDDDELQSSRPGPIMNFDLVQLEPEYTQVYEETIEYADATTWCDIFNNWQFMQLRTDLVPGEHFRCITMDQWD